MIFIFLLSYFNYLYFKLLIYTCLYKSNGLVDVITKNAGGNTFLYLNFTLEGMYSYISYI